MPLVRFEVRNEYRLSQPQLYKQTNPEDPKAVLDGVAVAGLVGILRQLGDLAEFAAEVFHGLQEQVISTASRSHKLLVRVQSIEAALPSLEKAVLAQTSHINFAYTAGSEWRSRIQNGHSHFIYNDLPRFIMDSYEECRDPPRLHLLDKFDTGGPGSCLKRYSDPTFFRRTSGNFKEPDVEKVPKEKKSRKNKKKRSSQRNVDFLRSASMPNQSDRMQFTTSTANGRTSSSHTTSTNDMAIKSDLGDHSNSFDSRTGSAYVECVFHLNSSAQPEEQEPKEFSSRLVHHNDVADSILSNKQTSSATEKFHHNSSSEPIVPTSSCDTWDEKAEIMEPKGLNPDGNEAPEMVTTDSDLGIQDEDIANFKNPDRMDVEFGDENIYKSSIDRNEFDEVESETENYMDALNTIESESENDLDCQTKHELKQFSSNVDDERMEDEVNKEIDVISDDHPSKYESHIPSVISIDSGMASDLPTSIPSKSQANENESHISGGPSNSENLPDTESSTGPNDLDDLKADTVVSEPLSSGYTGIVSSTSPDALDGSKAESVVSQPSSSSHGISNLMELPNGSTVSSSFKSEESQAELPCVRPVSFWTNGGLLGLEPSKPPDFSVSNTPSQDSVTRIKVEVLGPPNDTSTPSDDGERRKPGSMESIPSSRHEGCIPSSRHEGQDAEVDKASDFHHSNRISDVSDGLNKTSVVKPRNELPLNADAEAENGQENDENPSQTFGLGHRLLINGFRRQMSLAPDSKHEEVSLLKADALEQSNVDGSITCHATPEKAFNGKFGLKSSLGSLTSSPPLEHMKISFHPIDGFECSKLNLTFPDSNHSNGIIRDMFPSFQLVPEPGISLQAAGSDSDDDTFCRSSPYMSDDCLIHRSDSDSEQWESGESPENKNHELYDALCRKSSAETVSSSQQSGEMSNNGFHISSGLKSIYTENGADPSFSSLLDLPSFDAVNPLDHENLIELQYPKESNPSPPPPPPVQWWVSKSASNVAEDKQDKISEAHEHVDLNFQGSTVCQQQKPAPANEQRVDKEAVAFKPKSKQQDYWKLNVQKEANLLANGKGMDEKDDFLHQIRTKSFALRRTVTAKPTFTSGPAANDKFTAILEKANAIRQAVGSDDGEDDDSWSDT